MMDSAVQAQEVAELLKNSAATNILESVTDVFFAVDREWRFTYVNHQAKNVLGRKSGDLVGKILWEQYPDLLGTELEIAYRRAANEHVASSLTSFFPEHDRWYEVHAFPAPGGITVHFFDVSERKETEEALRLSEHEFRVTADRRKDEFLAMLAHELRNPLAALDNAVAVLKLASDQENITFAKKVIERQTRQLARLVDDLLDASRITSGNIRLKPERCDAGSILKHAAESIAPLIKERKHELVLDFEEGAFPICVDPTRMEQVLVNLLVNAAKYSENARRVYLGAKRQDDEIVITVEDQGFGIAPDKLPGMFELFVQGERSVARSDGGLGIGLTIVQKLTEMHGGRVTAFSEGLGKGCQFRVYLPVATPLAATGGERGPRDSARRLGARVLVIDDNVDMARSLAVLMKLQGNDVQVAYDGQDGIEVARAFKPEFVLLDIGLPGMDGYQVARVLRQELCCDRAVIVAISGYGQEEDRRRSREAGFDHHLVKPVNLDSLVSLLSLSH